MFRKARLLDSTSVGLYIDTAAFVWLAACRCGTSRPLHVAFFTVATMKRAGWDSLVGSGQDGPGVESQFGRHFRHLSRPSLGPTQRPV